MPSSRQRCAVRSDVGTPAISDSAPSDSRRARPVQQPGGGRAGAQAEHHPASHLGLDRSLGRLALERLQVDGHASASATAAGSVSGARQAKRSQMYTAGSPSTRDLPSSSGRSSGDRPSPKA